MNKEITSQQYSKIIQNITKNLEKIEEKSVVQNSDNSFEVVGTLEQIDRTWEIILVDGIEYDWYLKNNPVVIKDHEQDDIESIIWKTIEINKMVDTNNQKKLVFKWYFNDTEKWKLANKLYKDWFLNTVSIWYLVKERDFKNYWIIKRCEIVELSFCVIPANAWALKVKWYSKAEIESWVKSCLIVLNEEKEEENWNWIWNWMENENLLEKKDILYNILNEMQNISTLLSEINGKLPSPEQINTNTCTDIEFKENKGIVEEEVTNPIVLEESLKALINNYFNK